MTLCWNQCFCREIGTSCSCALSLPLQMRHEIDELNDTGALNHIPAYQSIELKGENHHFVNNVSNFFR